MIKKQQLPNFLWLVALLTTIMISYQRAQYSYQKGYINGAYVGASYFMIHSDFPTEGFLQTAVEQTKEETSKKMLEEVQKELASQRAAYNQHQNQKKSEQ